MERSGNPTGGMVQRGWYGPKGWWGVLPATQLVRDSMFKITDRALRIPSLKATANDQPADPREPPYCGAAPAYQSTPAALLAGRQQAADERGRDQAEADDFMRASEQARETLSRLCDRFSYRVVLGWLQREGRYRV